MVNETGIITDLRDAKIYKTIKIGHQVWMAENLAYDAKNLPRSSIDNMCTYNDEGINVKKYGYLYNSYFANKVCLINVGWKLPTEDDFRYLVHTLGGEGKGAYNSIIQNRVGGFSASLAGICTRHNSFLHEGMYGYYLSSSQYPDEAGRIWCLRVNGFDNKVNMWSEREDSMMSIRCLSYSF
ncbi:FISUMP domain-containing protein [Candidatus Neomarinimicrobiota bacterium]